MAVDPQPTTSKHTEMSRFCGPGVRDPIGGSSQLKYYPYLLALSNPKKIAGAGAFPPCPPPCAAARRGQNVIIAEQQVKTKPPQHMHAHPCTHHRMHRCVPLCCPERPRPTGRADLTAHGRSHKALTGAECSVRHAQALGVQARRGAAVVCCAQCWRFMMHGTWQVTRPICLAAAQKLHFSVG
jgi:hypothetical protein